MNRVTRIFRAISGFPTGPTGVEPTAVTLIGLLREKGVGLTRTGAKWGNAASRDRSGTRPDHSEPRRNRQSGAPEAAALTASRAGRLLHKRVYISRDKIGPEPLEKQRRHPSYNHCSVKGDSASFYDKRRRG